MKINFTILISAILCLALMLVSCGDSGSEQSKSEQSKTESSQNETSVGMQTQTNKPWYDTTVPDDYVSQDIYESSEEESSVQPEESEEISAESSDDSLPEEEEPNEEIGAEIIIPKNAATSYRVAFTKVSKLEATECITNAIIKVTAVYDGTYTRFLHATEGTFYHAVPGKYLYPCCNGFLGGDLNSVDSRYAVMLELDEEGELVSVSNEHYGHGGMYFVDFYSTFDKNAYSYQNDENGAMLYAYGDGAVICRELKTDYNVGEAFDNNNFEFSESSLGKYGLVNGGEIVIPFEYDYMVTTYGNTCGVVLAQKDGRSYYFSSNGKKLTPDGFDCGSQPLDNQAWVFEDGEGFILEFR